MSIGPREIDQTLAYYARHADDYIARANATSLSAVYAKFEPFLAAGSRILDLGCGGGRDARRFASLGHQVIALDPCRQMLAKAQADTPPELCGRIGYVRGASPDLPLVDGSCSAIWACASLLHLPCSAMPAALAECRRVLMPGGILSLSLKRGSGEHLWEGRWFAYWQIDPLTDLLQTIGFEVMLVQDQQESIWLYVLARPARADRTQIW